MIAAIFPILAFVGVFVVSQRSLTYGLLGTIIVGYFSGIVRANYQSIATTFFFDAAVGGLYFSVIFGHINFLKRAILSQGGQYCLLLILWPMFMTLLPINNFWVQLVALRGSVWLLPIVIIATRFNKNDILMIGRGLALLNLTAMVVGVMIYFVGVERFYPKNETTRIIYNSKDVGTGGGNYRVPSTFLSAHAYGNTMVLTLPILMGCLMQRKRFVFDSSLMLLGIVAAGVGILLCAARQPIWVLALVMLATWLQTGLSPTVGILLASLAFGGFYFSSMSDRLQRGFSFDVGDGDTGYTLYRIYGSVNEEIVTVFLDYPFGAGMGSAVGTSLPYFLAAYAPEQVGHENEYSRIQVDQGWIGLGLWLAFLYWTHFPRPRTPDRKLGFMLFLMHSTTGMFWATAFIGTGILSSVPASAILLAQMGFLVGQRDFEKRRIIKMKQVNAWIKQFKATRFNKIAPPVPQPSAPPQTP